MTPNSLAKLVPTSLLFPDIMKVIRQRNPISESKS